MRWGAGAGQAEGRAGEGPGERAGPPAVLASRRVVAGAGVARGFAQGFAPFDPHQRQSLWDHYLRYRVLRAPPLAGSRGRAPGLLLPPARRLLPIGERSGHRPWRRSSAAARRRPRPRRRRRTGRTRDRIAPVAHCRRRRSGTGSAPRSAPRRSRGEPDRLQVRIAGCRRAVRQPVGIGAQPQRRIERRHAAPRCRRSPPPAARRRACGRAVAAGPGRRRCGSGGRSRSQPCARRGYPRNAPPPADRAAARRSRSRPSARRGSPCVAHAVPAMSRCAHGLPLTKRWMNCAAVIAPPGRPPTFFMSAISRLDLLVVGLGQRHAPALSRRSPRRPRAASAPVRRRW